MEMTRSIVEEAVRERMDRMQSNRVDLLQVGRDTPGPVPYVHGLSADGTRRKRPPRPRASLMALSIRALLKLQYSFTGTNMPIVVTSSHSNCFRTCKGKV